MKRFQARRGNGRFARNTMEKGRRATVRALRVATSRIAAALLPTPSREDGDRHHHRHRGGMPRARAPRASAPRDRAARSRASGQGPLRTPSTEHICSMILALVLSLGSQFASRATSRNWHGFGNAETATHRKVFLLTRI